MESNQQVEENMYPNNGEHFQAIPRSEEQERQENVQKAKVLGALPLIDDILARFDARIKLYDSVSSITVDPNQEPEAFMRLFMTGQATKQNLIQERIWLASLRRQHSNNTE